ncbi:hypothetical protein SCHPADRAFT_893538 [Schizopora paradoxa]|uniref:C2H2-type domain-containing protein n=1 Tax=Schizopora paradoxa TaxID=27342 RepID=A0A0H2RBN6_9AGAM|nr:hypothetical protein SCHPADRAFT_893538 [Schizopora paradoxa]
MHEPGEYSISESFQQQHSVNTYVPHLARMPRHGHDPGNVQGRRGYPCHACGRSVKNKSGLTQHLKKCPVLVEERLRSAREPSSGSSDGEQEDPPGFNGYDDAGHPPEEDNNDRMNLDGDGEGGGGGGGGAGEGEGPDDVPLRLAGDRRYVRRYYHKAMTALPCDEDGNFLPEDAQPVPDDRPQDNWSPFRNRIEFEFADLIFRRNQMPKSQINDLLKIWAASMVRAVAQAEDAEADFTPFGNVDSMLATIDSIQLGDAPWESFVCTPVDQGPDAPAWTKQVYEVWFRNVDRMADNMIANPDFKNEFDLVPYREFDEHGVLRLCDFFSGGWAWEQADKICEDERNIGSMFVPLILGNDKTTVSVATGQNEFYPVYMSIGNVRNNVRRAHRNAITVVAFLAIPKTTQEHQNSVAFRDFRRQITHSSFSVILGTSKLAMETYKVRKCFDKHFRRIIHGVGPIICDYPDQAVHACIIQGWCPLCLSSAKNLDTPSLRRTQRHRNAVIDAFGQQHDKKLREDYGIVASLVPFTNDFPRADIHELISSDLLHQVIKGTFKDHLVTWVGEFLVKKHGKTVALKYVDDIDRRIAAVPPFSNLRRFPQGRGFKQWTGDDSKALMKVYLPAIQGHVPAQMVRAIRHFLDFCYLARRNVLDQPSLDAMDSSLRAFHADRKIFITEGVRKDPISLPRQHSLVHYTDNIRKFGAPNGTCTSITESQHIVAVKETWRRSNRFNALSQMLISNQRLSKLAAAKVDFIGRGMMQGTVLDAAYDDVEETPDGQRLERHVDIDDNTGREDGGIIEGPHVDGEVTLATNRHQTFVVKGYPRRTDDLARHEQVQWPEFPAELDRFVYDILHPNEAIDSEDEVDEDIRIPHVQSNINIVASATAVFYAPSDICGVGGMRKEIIRVTPSWRGGAARHDCVFVQTDRNTPGFRGLDVARIKVLFSFKHDGRDFSCALVHWFKRVADSPDSDTGMWVVQLEYYREGPVLRNREQPERPQQSIISVDTIVRAAHLIPVYGSEFIPHDVNLSNVLTRFNKYYVNKYADHHSYEIVF